MKLLKAFVVIAVLGFTAYLGIMLGKPMFMYRAFKADVQDMTRMAIYKNKLEFKQAVLEKAKEYGLEITKRNIQVTGTRGQYRINIAWSEMVYLFSKKYDFSLEVP